MLASLLKYGGIYAKTAAIRSKRLLNEDYEKLIHMTSVYDIATYLKNNTYYSEVLKNDSDRSLHRADLEAILYSYYENVVQKIYGFVTGDSRKFLKVYFYRQEIEIMKDVLRSIVAKNTYNKALPVNELFFKNIKVDIKKLAQCNSVMEFLEALKGTEYERQLEPLTKIKGRQNIFDVETSLDRFYFDKTWQLKDKFLTKSDNKLLTPLLGYEIDIQNILWIYRCKEYYKVDKEHIYTYLIPRNFKLKRDLVKRMVEADDPQDVIKVLDGTPYAYIFQTKGDQTIEDNSDELILRLHKKLLRKNPYSILTPISEIYFIDMEVKNIINIIEGVRYNVSADYIRDLIVY